MTRELNDKLGNTYLTQKKVVVENKKHIIHAGEENPIKWQMQILLYQ